MRGKPKEYEVSEKSSVLIETIINALNNSDNYVNFEVSDKGGTNISKSLPIAFTPYLGPLIKLNFKAVDVEPNGAKCKLILNRTNGSTYKLHILLMILFLSLTVIVSSYHIIFANDNIGIKILGLPLFGLFYMLGIELLAQSNFHSICKEIEKIITNRNLNFKKL